jgi:hypothetical protein
MRRCDSRGAVRGRAPQRGPRRSRREVEAGQVARDSTAGEAPAEATESSGGGAQVIDLAELLSRSIKSAAKPGPAKAKSAEGSSASKTASQSEEKPEKGKCRKKRGTG